MPADFDTLARVTRALADKSNVMPIDEVRLATAFAELPDRESVATRLLDELVFHDNFHVRRVAIHGCRLSRAFQIPGLQSAATRLLDDPEDWVRYDAAWLIQDAGYDSSEIRHKLARLAEGVPLAGEPQPWRSGPKKTCAARARQALIGLAAASSSL